MNSSFDEIILSITERKSVLGAEILKVEPFTFYGVKMPCREAL